MKSVGQCVGVDLGAPAATLYLVFCSGSRVRSGSHAAYSAAHAREATRSPTLLKAGDDGARGKKGERREIETIVERERRGRSR